MNDQSILERVFLFAVAILGLFLIAFLMDWYTRHGRQFKLYKKKIISRGPDREPYLVRYTLFTCKYFSVKVHNILLSDYQCLHDHPWAFVTFLLKGGYVEHTEKGSKVYGRFSLLRRKAEFLHRLEVHQPVWSFVVTFRKTRMWGFKTPTKWVKWYEYTPTNTCE